MKGYYVPILVDRDGKTELWRFDLDGYSLAELSEIREVLIQNKKYTRSIAPIDKLLREKAETILPYNKVHGTSYVRVYKENRKQEKIKKHRKTRRR